MKISPDDYEEILDHLINELDEGSEFIIYSTEHPVSKDDLVSFSNARDMIEYLKGNTTGQDAHEYLPMRTVCWAMSEALENKSLILESSGLIDIEAMVNAYHKRLEEDFANRPPINVGDSSGLSNVSGDGNSINKDQSKDDEDLYAPLKRAIGKDKGSEGNQVAKDESLLTKYRKGQGNGMGL